MGITSAVLSEFVRRIFRVCDEEDLLRDEYLDGLSDAALDAIQKGKALISSSGNGTTASYERFKGWDPESLLELISKARSIVQADTIDLALANVKPVRHFSNDFGGIEK